MSIWSQCWRIEQAYDSRALTITRVCCWLLVLYAVGISQVFTHNNNLNIIFLDVKCEKVSDKLQFIECIKKNNRTQSTLTVRGMLREDISAVVAKLSLFLLQKGNRKTKLYTLTVEYCGLMTRSSRRNMLKIFYESIKSVAINFPIKCPFKKNVLYALQDYRVYPAMLPIFVPRINFTIAMHVYSGEELIVYYNIVGAVCNDQDYCRSLLSIPH